MYDAMHDDMHAAILRNADSDTGTDCPICGHRVALVITPAKEVYAEHTRGDQPCPASGQPTIYRNDTWVVDGPVRVCFTDLGEGHDGDYDEDNPNDEPLYRLDVHVRADSGYDGEETDDAGWLYPQGGSVCTLVNIHTPGPRVMALIRQAAAELRATVEADESIKGAVARLSWLS